MGVHLALLPRRNVLNQCVKDLQTTESAVSYETLFALRLFNAIKYDMMQADDLLTILMKHTGSKQTKCAVSVSVKQQVEIGGGDEDHKSNKPLLFVPERI